MEIFDCNCSIGTGPIPAFRYARAAVDLLEEMDFAALIMPWFTMRTCALACLFVPMQVFYTSLRAIVG